jgi:hypothetical protein
MRAKSKLVSFVLSAVLLFGFALTASAQVNYQLSSTPTNVTQTGLTELLGEVRLTQNNPPTNVAQTTIAGSISVLYQGVPITNTFSGQKFLTAGTGIYADAGGITVTGTGGFNNALVGVLVESNPGAAGGLVTITLPGGLAINPGDTISIAGVRAMVSGLPVNTDVQASLQANPPTSNLFANSVVRVARTFPGLVVGVSGVGAPICTTPTNPTLTLTEGFPGSFIQYVTVAGVAPANPRPRYGANANVQIHISIGTLPTPDVTLTWPGSVTATSGVGTLVLLSSTSSDAVYQFTTTDQGASDSGVEVFNISPTLEVASTAGFGQATVQAQLYPASGSSSIPRFNDPLKPDAPGGNFFSVSKCVTNLLFPFVTNKFGYNTGLAIVNTSVDGPAISPASTPQSGGITLYGFRQFTGAGGSTGGGTDSGTSAGTTTGTTGTTTGTTGTTTGTTGTTTGGETSGTTSGTTSGGSSGGGSGISIGVGGGTVAQAPAPITVTIPNLDAGDTWTATVGGAGLVDFQGYIIAVCQFQYAHGFAFITGQVNGAVAEGYLALVIPDPAVTGGARRAAAPNPTSAAGESLSN